MYENFLGNKTAWKILKVLYEAPGKGVSISEIKNITKAGNFALSQALEQLEKYKILLSKKVGKKKKFIGLIQQAKFLKFCFSFLSLKELNSKIYSLRKLFF
jgi:predicted transcriptional regulator